MNRPGDDHDDPRLRARLKSAYEGAPPAPLTARVAEMARPARRGVIRADVRSSPAWGELVAPAAGIVLLAGLLVGLWPLFRAAASGSGSLSLIEPWMAAPGRQLFGEALLALSVPLALAWIFELSRGAPQVRRFLR